MNESKVVQMLIEQAVKSENVPLPEMWKRNVERVCIKVVTRLVGEAALRQIEQDGLKEPT